MSKLSLLPVVIDISVVQDSDNLIEFQLTDGSGNAVDITNDSVQFTARATHAGTLKIATKTNGVGDHSVPLAGKTQFNLSRTDLTTATLGLQVNWVYEVRRLIAGVQEVVYVSGALILAPSVGN